MKRVIAIVGDYYHNGDISRDALDWALDPLIDARELKVEYVPWEGLQEQLSSRPDAVVLFKENRLNPKDPEPELWMSETAAQAIKAYVDSGGGWLAWHSGLASYQYAEDQIYTNLLRGHFVSHPELNEGVRYTGSIPSPAGLGEAVDFTIQDEHYFVECDTDHTEVFLRSESEDGESIAGWRHGYGAGRVCCLTPAHKREGLLHSDFSEVLRSAVLWCCGL